VADQRPSWNMETEPYEDFLERLPEVLQKRLADGTAFVAKPVDGFGLMGRFMASARDDDELVSWLKFVAEIETEDECKQAISDIASLEIVTSLIAKALFKRRDEIHKETCEVCGAADEAPSKGNVKRALDAARQAFMDAIQDDPEPWKGDSE